MKDFGKSFRNVRLVNGYSQKELAKKTGISQQNISRWEKNAVLPNIYFCIVLADFYGISVDELIDHDIIYSKGMIESSSSSQGA